MNKEDIWSGSWEGKEGVRGEFRERELRKIVDEFISTKGKLG